MKRQFTAAYVALAAIASAAPAFAQSANDYLVRLTASDEVPLPGSAFYPEGIGISSSGDLYVGSLSERRILRLDRQTRQIEQFSAPDADLLSVIGVHVSKDDRTVYACSSDPKGVHSGRRSEIVALDIQTGSVVRRAALPEGGLCNDVAELEDGTVLVTDSFGGRILALPPQSSALAVWVQSPEFVGQGFNLNGIVSLGDEVYAVKYNSGELFRFSRSQGSTSYEAIQLSRRLNGPDGLEQIGENRLLVVEGLTGTISMIDVTTGVVSTLAENLDSPTTAAIHDRYAYVVQGQLDHFFGMTQQPPKPFALKRIRLP